ncbi:MAG: pentapeptide repeat-containing protein, partial [SAR324 cluster bacterium]|nr:pentapeptide repeat-containing protein [SAR324 cluster bacterium]
QVVDISREPPPLDAGAEQRSAGEAEAGAGTIPVAAGEPVDAADALNSTASPAESLSSTESSPPAELLGQPALLGEPVAATDSGAPTEPIPSGEAEPIAEREAAPRAETAEPAANGEPGAPTRPIPPGKVEPSAERNAVPQTELAASSSAVDSLTEEESPLPPFEIETYGEFGQAEFDASDSPKTGLRYSDATFELTALPEGVLVGSDLTGTSFARVKFLSIHRYRDCIMTGIDLRRIELLRRERPHNFLRCNLTGASFAEAAIEYTLFAHCDLSGSLWKGARLDRVKFVNCQIDRVQWGQVDLSRTVMSADMMAGTDFTEAAHPPHNYPGTRDPAPAPAQTGQPDPEAAEAASTFAKADSVSSQEPSAAPDCNTPDDSDSGG